MLDSSEECVESSAREQGIAGMDIMDVPLHKVISGGNNNWALRQVAHGRTVQWENFRSRQEAIFCGVLMRGLRSEQDEQEGECLSEAVLSVR